MSDGLIAWLQNWYKGQCDGDWEHTFGIKLDTLDNPGWSLIIDLEDTELEGTEFETVKIDRSVNDWLMCEIKDRHFYGRGGPENLTELLSRFRNWVEE